MRTFITLAKIINRNYSKKAKIDKRILLRSEMLIIANSPMNRVITVSPSY
jgi:hypothetical protein